MHTRTALVGAAALAATVPLAGARPAGAASLTVTTTADSGPGSLRDVLALADATAGPDVVTFASGLTGTISLTTGQLRVRDSVTITGPGADVLSVDAGGRSRVLYLYSVGTEPSTVTVSGLTLRGGASTGSGGAIVAKAVDLTLRDVVVEANRAPDRGGGVALVPRGVQFAPVVGSLRIVDSTVTGNRADNGDGGGVSVEAARFVTVEGSTFVGNVAGASGGAIHLAPIDAPFTFSASTADGNQATMAGGGVAVDDLGGDLLIDRSTLSGNSAGLGGGLFVNTPRARLDVLNSTVAGNSARYGAGIAVGDAGTATRVAHSTVAANRATDAGGGLLLARGSVSFAHSILADNTAPLAGTDEVGPTNGTVTATWSLVEHYTPAGTDYLVGVDPMLAPLASQGGPTATMVPLPGSPVVDAGDPAITGAPATDQRGNARQSGRIDIGAVESVAQAEATIIRSDEFTIVEDTVLLGGPSILLANDVPVGAFTVAVATPPSHGTLDLVADGSLRYVPAANFHGTDVFWYALVPAGGSVDGSPRTYVQINVVPVNDAPVAVADSATVASGSSVAVAVLANDGDVDGDTLAISAVTQGTKGTVSVVGDRVVYRPRLDSSGSDTFTYTVSDGTSTATATVTVEISATLDVIRAVDDAYTVLQDQVLVVPSPSIVANDMVMPGLDVRFVTQPAHGTVEFSASGALTYRPATGFRGTDTFVYALLIPGGTVDSSPQATVTITVEPVDPVDPPTPVAVDDVYGMAEDGVLEVKAPGLLANDSDAVSAEVTLVAGTAHGTLDVRADGSFTYRPLADFHGSDSFKYRLTPDGEVATVAITVEPVDDPPVAVADSLLVVAGSSAEVAVLANDTDADGDPLTLVAVTPGTRGTVTIVGGSVRYTASGTSAGTDSFTYTVSDGTTTVTGTVWVVIAKSPSQGEIPATGADPWRLLRLSLGLSLAGLAAVGLARRRPRSSPARSRD